MVVDDGPPLSLEVAMSIINYLTAVLTVMSTAMTIYITVISSQIDAKVKLNDAALRTFQAHLDERFRAADLELRKTIEERAAKQAEETFNLQIYEKVYVALEKSDKRKHEVAYALVQSLEDDQRLKKYLLGLFQSSNVARDTRDLAAISIFRIDQQALARDTPRGAKVVNYDVFWCEGHSDWEQLAVAAADRIRTREGVGRVRVRMLPDAVNREPRFLVSGLMIRIDPGEEPLGHQMKTWIDPVVAPNGFKLDGNAQGTPNYLSAFVCGNR
jgi:hypothetical protein